MSIIYKRLQNTHARCKWNSFECGNKVQRSQRLNLIQSLKEKPRQTVPVKRTDVHFVAASVCAGEREAASTKSATRSRHALMSKQTELLFVLSSAALRCIFARLSPRRRSTRKVTLATGSLFLFETTRWVFVCFVLKAYFVGTFFSSFGWVEIVV